MNTLRSSGWIDPWAFGTHYWNFEYFFNRPDGVNYYLTYRQFDPVGSKVISAAMGYRFSPKYSGNFSVSYDFGTKESGSAGVYLNRIGTDVTVSMGFTYTQATNTAGFMFMIMPNLLAQQGSGGLPASFSGAGGAGAFGATGGGR